MAGLQETLLPIFLEEAEDGLAQIRQLIGAWEQDAQSISADILEDARRAAHTIKGTAGLVKRMQFSAVAKRLEEILDSLKSGDHLEQSDLTLVINCHQQLEVLLQYAHEGNPEPTPESENVELESNFATDGMAGVSDDDLINDFALPFLMKLHQASSGIDEAIKPVCCRFFLGGRQYYISIADVVEIAERKDITFLPYGPSYITGLISLRGDVIPVINLAALEQREFVFPAVYYLVVARSNDDNMAFISDQLPNINLKTAGHKIDVNDFLEHYSVKAS